MEVRNNPDWLLKFLALEASDFPARIYLLDLAVFWPFRLFFTGSFSSLSTWIHLLSCSSSPMPTEAVRPTAEVVFNMKVSEATSLLNP